MSACDEFVGSLGGGEEGVSAEGEGGEGDEVRLVRLRTRGREVVVVPGKLFWW